MFEIRHCHYCSVDAHTKSSDLFLFMKWICVVGAWGQYRGQLCVHLYYALGLYSCLICSLGADSFTVLFSHVVES